MNVLVDTSVLSEELRRKNRTKSFSPSLLTGLIEKDEHAGKQRQDIDVHTSKSSSRFCIRIVLEVLSLETT